MLPTNAKHANTKKTLLPYCSTKTGQTEIILLDEIR